MNTTETYSYSSQAYWRNGGYGAMMSALPGTLGLTTGGRLVFTLDSGKILFSAPVALIKRKNEPMYGWMRLVIGPRLYTLQFYTNTYSAEMAGTGGMLSVAASMQDASQGRSAFSEWISRLDQAQNLPADSEQIIAAIPTASILQARKFGKKTLYRSQFFTVLIYAIVIIGAIGAGLVGSAHKSSLMVFVIALAVGGMYALIALLRRFNRRRLAMDATPHPSEDVSVQPADILPPGTQPSGSFGLTTGKQLLLGLVLVPVVIVVALIVAAIIITIVNEVRG